MGFFLFYKWGAQAKKICRACINKGEHGVVTLVLSLKMQVSISDEPETLYKRLSLLVKGHDKAVLDSYEYFAVLAAKELGISVEKV